MLPLYVAVAFAFVVFLMYCLLLLAHFGIERGPVLVRHLINLFVAKCRR